MPAPTLYHGSSREMAAGSHKARVTPGHFRRPIELLMEAGRPASAPSRLSSFFLVKQVSEITDAGGSMAFVYAVRPMGVYSKHHFGWMGLVYDTLIPFCRHQAPEEEKESAAPDLLRLPEWVHNYWEGVPYRSPSKDRPVWEYLAPEILVLERVVTPA